MIALSNIFAVFASLWATSRFSCVIVLLCFGLGLYDCFIPGYTGWAVVQFLGAALNAIVLTHRYRASLYAPTSNLV